MARIQYAMRVILFSFRTIWASVRTSFRACRKIWGLALLLVALGCAGGVLTACFVEEPQPVCVIGNILAGTYTPFSRWGGALAVLALGVLLVYVSAMNRHRPLFWLYVLAVGYVLGRIAAFACMVGVLGVVSLVLCELPFVLLPLCFAVAYYCAMADVVLTTLRLKCNKSSIQTALRYAAWGAVCSFVYIMIWGLISAIINLV